MALSAPDGKRACRRGRKGSRGASCAWVPNIGGLRAADCDLERAARGAYADAIFADDRCCTRCAPLASLVRCPACRTINVIDLRRLDRHHTAAITSLIPWLSRRPHACRLGASPKKCARSTGRVPCCAGTAKACHQFSLILMERLGVELARRLRGLLYGMAHASVGGPIVIRFWLLQCAVS